MFEEQLAVPCVEYGEDGSDLGPLWGLLSSEGELMSCGARRVEDIGWHRSAKGSSIRF
jgi:hypothetical protein